VKDHQFFDGQSPEGFRNIPIEFIQFGQEFPEIAVVKSFSGRINGGEGLTDGGRLNLDQFGIKPDMRVFYFRSIISGSVR